MRRIKIYHLTEYQFPANVTLNPHRLLLRPREGHDVRIESSRLHIFPAQDTKWHRDMLDNSVAVVTFREPAQRLTIESEILIAHYEEAPLDFIVEDYAAQYPFQYDERERAELAPFSQPIYDNRDNLLQGWLDRQGITTRNVETYVMLDQINRAITRSFQYMIREVPGVQSPQQTIDYGSGSCRDYATLFVEICRQLGLASRFVSGYLHAPSTEQGRAATHAWAEVFLPGAGWKGFDQTSGLLTGADHIPVAVARHPESVPPVAGSFLGPASPQPNLRVDVQVSLC